jgi:hypothetical protein
LEFLGMSDLSLKTKMRGLVCLISIIALVIISNACRLASESAPATARAAGQSESAAFALRSFSKPCYKGGIMNISDITNVRDMAAGIPGATRVFEG